MSSFSKKNRFHMECLEGRQMMAGDIDAFFGAPGTLFIREAAGSVGGNQIVVVSVLPDGKVKVEGGATPSNPTGSKVNDQFDPVEFVISGFMNIDMDLGNGQDEVIVFGTQPGQNTPKVNNLTIKTSSPSDNPNDADTVGVSGITVLGKLDVNTGAGRDMIRVDNTLVAQDMTIRAGTFNPAGLTDRDDVVLNEVRVDRSLLITTGESNDAVTIKKVNLPRGDQGGHITIDTGNGADAINVGSIPVVVPIGAPLANFGPVTAAGGLHIKAGTDLQNDFDNVRIQDAFFDQNIVVELGDGNDNLNMVNALAKQSITLAGQKGNDTMNVTEVEAFDGFFALMGDGDDLLNMTFVKSQRMTLDGGSGTNDRLNRSQMPFIPSQTVKGFEFINGQPTLPNTINPAIVVKNLPKLKLA
jgi:hypothetical protein